MAMICTEFGGSRLWRKYDADNNVWKGRSFCEQEGNAAP